MVPRVAVLTGLCCHMSRVRSPFTAEDQSHKPFGNSGVSMGEITEILSSLPCIFEAGQKRRDARYAGRLLARAWPGMSPFVISSRALSGACHRPDGIRNSSAVMVTRL
jgi:hypothetical protein